MPDYELMLDMIENDVNLHPEVVKVLIEKAQKWDESQGYLNGKM